MGAQISGFILLILACAGNAEWWVVLINRRHSLKYRHQQLLRIRLMHDVGILGFPIFIFAFAEFSDRGLLRGGTFFELPWTLQTIMAITLTGIVPLAYCAVRNLTRRPPRAMRGLTAEVTDCLLESSTSTRREILGDRSSVFLKFPWNQVFQIEVNRKKLVIPLRQTAGEVDTGTRHLCCA